MVCDHQALVQSFKDEGPLKGRRSDRLNRWRIFLSKYRGRITIVHKLDRLYRNVNALSRLPSSLPSNIPTSTLTTLLDTEISKAFLTA